MHVVDNFFEMNYEIGGKTADKCRAMSASPVGEGKELVVSGNNWKCNTNPDTNNGYLPRTRAENGNNEATGPLLAEGNVATTVVHIGSGGAPRTMLHHVPVRSWGLSWERCLIFSVCVLFFTSAISLLLLLTNNTCDLTTISK